VTSFFLLKCVDHDKKSTGSTAVAMDTENVGKYNINTFSNSSKIMLRDTTTDFIFHVSPQLFNKVPWLPIRYIAFAHPLT